MVKRPELWRNGKRAHRDTGKLSEAHYTIFGIR